MLLSLNVFGFFQYVANLDSIHDYCDAAFTSKTKICMNSLNFKRIHLHLNLLQRFDT